MSAGAPNLRAINRGQFSSAKRYWAASVATKLVIFGIGAWAIFLSPPPSALPQVLLALAVLSEVSQIRSDVLKSRAEAVLRTLDICQSFGRDISVSDKREMIVGMPKDLRRQIEQVDVHPYFDNAAPAGPRKAVENLVESAWYSRHLAGVMIVTYGTIIILLVALSLAALFFVAHQITDTMVRDKLARTVTGWLLLIVALNMLKNVWGYIRLYQRCERTEIVCAHLMGGEIGEADAVKHWYEYQITRASSPLIPDWLWRLMKARLDHAWALSRLD